MIQKNDNLIRLHWVSCVYMYYMIFIFRLKDTCKLWTSLSINFKLSNFVVWTSKLTKLDKFFLISVGFLRTQGGHITIKTFLIWSVDTWIDTICTNVCLTGATLTYETALALADSFDFNPMQSTPRWRQSSFWKLHCPVRRQQLLVESIKLMCLVDVWWEESVSRFYFAVCMPDIWKPHT